MYCVVASFISFYPNVGPTSLEVAVPSTMSHDSVVAFFNLMPGMEYCKKKLTGLSFLFPTF